MGRQLEIRPGKDQRTEGKGGKERGREGGHMRATYLEDEEGFEDLL